MSLRNPVDPLKYPFCYDGYQYALDVVSGKIPNCIYAIGACERFFRDLKNGIYPFDYNAAEKYLRQVQKFHHVKGEWKTPNIHYEPWQNFLFMNVMGFINPDTGKRRFRQVHAEIPRAHGKAHSITEKVVTPQGVKLWGEIGIGSKLYARDGSVCTVTGKTPITKQRLFEMVLSDGSVIECSAEHEWFTSDKIEREKMHGNTAEGVTYESVRETREIARTLKKGGEFNHAIYSASHLLGELNGKDVKRYVVDVRYTGRYVDMFCVEVDSKDSSYLIGETLVPTHNSLMASQTTLYFLALDNPVGNEIACASTKKEAARIVLDSAMAMALKNERYLKKTGVKVRAHKIEHKKSNSFVRALSSEKKSQDGLNDILCVMDELHAISQAFFDVIVSGMKKRNDSLMLCITTAGFDTGGVGYSQSNYAKKVALGEIEDDTLFAIIYTVDQDDDIMLESTWRKANPGYGISVDPIMFKADMAKAEHVPSALNNIKVKNLNIWTSEANAFFSMKAWDNCQDPTLNIEDFKGQKVIGAIDLSSKIDIAAKVYIARDYDGKYCIFTKGYIPKETIKESANKTLYENCTKEELFRTDGQAIDYGIIEGDIEKDFNFFNIETMMFDPWNATQISQNLMKQRINMTEFRMNTGNFSEPMKLLDAYIREGKIRHNCGDLTRFCMANTVSRMDANDNAYPRKSHEDKKIDIAVAIIMAFAGWVVQETEESIYEERGVRII